MFVLECHLENFDIRPEARNAEYTPIVQSIAIMCHMTCRLIPSGEGEGKGEEGGGGEVDVYLGPLGFTPTDDVY